MTLPMGRPMREIFGETVAALADDDPRIVMLDGDVGSSTRADIFEKAHPDRYLQMGIAEQNMLGVAAGLATMGLIPFISTFVSFAVVRPLDQVRVLIAQTGANVKITARLRRPVHGPDGDEPHHRGRPRDHAGDAGHGHGGAGGRRRGGPGAALGRGLPGAVLRPPRAATRPRVCSTTSYRFAFGKAVVGPRGARRHAHRHRERRRRASWRPPSCSPPDGIDAHVLHVPTLKPLDVGGDRGRRGPDRPGDHGRGAHGHRRAGRRGGRGAGRASADAGRPDRPPGRLRPVGPERRRCWTSTGCRRRGSRSRCARSWRRA